MPSRNPRRSTAAIGSPAGTGGRISPTGTGRTEPPAERQRLSVARYRRPRTWVSPAGLLHRAKDLADRQTGPPVIRASAVGQPPETRHSGTRLASAARQRVPSTPHLVARRYGKVSPGEPVFGTYRTILA